MTATSLQHHVHSAPNMATNHNNSNSNSNHGMRNPYGVGDGLAAPPSLGSHTPGVAALSSGSGSSSPSPELIPSTSGVPNPFANRPVTSPIPSQGNNSNAGMNSINWESHKSPVPQQIGSSCAPMPVQVPNPFQPIKQPTNGLPIASGIRFPAYSGAALQQQQQQHGMDLSPQQQQPLVACSTNNENANPGETASASPESKGGLNNRRQKRLERNRESARLSRRRRKQYLEVLEERVKNLSVEMDKGRRHHVAVSVDILKQKKCQLLMDPSATLTDVENVAASRELRVAATFLTQQLSSLSMSPHIKFLLWLSMQNDVFFRGGRASSERLSAARIGERVGTTGETAYGVSHNHLLTLFLSVFTYPFLGSSKTYSCRCCPAEMIESLHRMECGPCSAMKLDFRTIKKKRSAHFRRRCCCRTRVGSNVMPHQRHAS